MPGVNRRRPRLLPVTDRVYSSTGYAISNVLYVITNQSVVVIDTTESIACARASFADFHNICAFPVSHIIYTHYHNDHVKGARAFCSPGTQIIANIRLEDERTKNRMLAGYRVRADILQFGLTLPLGARGVTHKASYGANPYLNVKPDHDNYLRPTVTFDQEYKFSAGGTDFELYHTEGETYDHLMVWLPKDRVLFPGDLFYGNFPMLNNPLKPARPVLAWAESLDRMRTLRPKFLVPSHGHFVSGARAVDSALANYAEAIRYVHDETVRLMNEGMLLEQICRKVRLPDRLAKLPYLRERYGTVRWTVRGLFLEYAGWYGWNPTDLKLSPAPEFARAIMQAYGSAAPLLQRAREAADAGNNQLALQLTDVVLAARPRNPVARALNVRCLRELAADTFNGVERNIYLSAATERQHGPAE